MKKKRERNERHCDYRTYKPVKYHMVYRVVWRVYKIKKQDSPNRVFCTEVQNIQIEEELNKITSKSYTKYKISHFSQKVRF